MLFKNTKTHYLGFVCLFLFASVKLLIIAVKNNVLLSSSYNQILHYLTFIFCKKLDIWKVKVSRAWCQRDKGCQRSDGCQKYSSKEGKTMWPNKGGHLCGGEDWSHYIRRRAEHPQGLSGNQTRWVTYRGMAIPARPFMFKGLIDLWITEPSFNLWSKQIFFFFRNLLQPSKAFSLDREKKVIFIQT